MIFDETQGSFYFSPLNFARGDCFLSDGAVDGELGKKYLSALPKRMRLALLNGGSFLPLDLTRKGGLSNEYIRSLRALLGNHRRLLICHYLCLFNFLVAADITPVFSAGTAPAALGARASPPVR